MPYECESQSSCEVEARVALKLVLKQRRGEGGKRRDEGGGRDGS